MGWLLRERNWHLSFESNPPLKNLKNPSEENTPARVVEQFWGTRFEWSEAFYSWRLWSSSRCRSHRSEEFKMQLWIPRVNGVCEGFRSLPWRLTWVIGRSLKTLVQGEQGEDYVFWVESQPLQPDVELSQQLELVYQIETSESWFYLFNPLSFWTCCVVFYSCLSPSSLSLHTPHLKHFCLSDLSYFSCIVMSCPNDYILWSFISSSFW